jgi:hypothetical protein
MLLSERPPHETSKLNSALTVDGIKMSTVVMKTGPLILCGTNDFDKAGLALLDEFGDCLSAYLKDHGAVRVLSVEIT